MKRILGLLLALATGIFLNLPGRAEAAGENILIAYFSYSGVTANVARQISDITGGTLFEIRPANAYPAYDECLDVAKAEKNNNSRPAIAERVENIDDYDVIFVGYPIWWYDAPMIVLTFLESYDFSGKTVIPFATSGGSPLSDSLESVRESASGANIAEGILANDTSDIEPWIRELGYANK